jgi:hypothetical protein
MSRFQLSLVACQDPGTRTSGHLHQNLSLKWRSTVPAVVIDGKLAECCKNHGVDEATLRVESVGVAA